MPRLRTAALAFAAVGVLAATFALTAGSCRPDGPHRPGQRGRRDDCDAHGHGQSRQRRDGLVVRVRHLHLVRVEDRDDCGLLGSANVPVSAPLTGLTPATTYHYRLVAKNASGTSNGSDGVFTTASPPVVVTSAATGVGPTSATLGGDREPMGSRRPGRRIRNAHELRLEDRERNAGWPGTPRRSRASVSGLTAGTTYHSAWSRRTPPARARARTDVYSPPPGRLRSRSSATSSTRREPLNGRVDPTAARRRGSSSTGRARATARRHRRRAPAPARARRASRRPVSGLTGGQRLPLPPRRDERRRNDRAPTRRSRRRAPGRHHRRGRLDRAHSATLNGSVTPNGQATTWYFEYGTSTAYGSCGPHDERRAPGRRSTNVYDERRRTSTQDALPLPLVATNASGTSLGADAILATTGAPAVRRGRRRSHRCPHDHGTVNGTLDPKGSSTTWRFELRAAHGVRSARPVAELQAAAG